MQTQPQSVVLIAGPTASGKSALAARLATMVGGETINADSMQVYRDLRILTARPTPEEEAIAPHHLFGIADAAEAWSVGQWLRQTVSILDRLRRDRKPAIIVGGTGLYFHALTRGLAHIPPVPAEVRETAVAEFSEAGEAAFRQRLAIVDPLAEARISPGDGQRLVRAFSVYAATGRPLSAWQDQTEATLAPGSWRGIVLDPPRPTLYERCDARLQAMIKKGALDEVARLLLRELDPGLPVMKALGVTAFAAQLKGELTAAQALEQASAETRRYAKRQITWQRNQNPLWPRIDDCDPEAQWEALMRLQIV